MLENIFYYLFLLLSYMAVISFIILLPLMIIFLIKSLWREIRD